MSVRVTDFRIDRVEIREDEFYRLPTKTQQLIQAYSSPLYSGKPDVLAFELPVYRWEEIKASMCGTCKGVKRVKKPDGLGSMSCPECQRGEQVAR